MTQLTFSGRNFFPEWSPDGQWIAYDRTVPLDSIGIWIMRPDGSEKQKVASGIFPYWQDSTSLIFVGLHSEIYKTNLQDSSVTQLTHLNQENPIADIRYPAFSPELSQIAFQIQDAASGIFSIWLMNIDGSNLQKFIEHASFPEWGPNGNKLIYTDTRRENGFLWIIDISTGDKRQLTN